MNQPAHLSAFKDWLQRVNGKTNGTANVYARFLTRCAEHYGEVIDGQVLKTDADADQIIQRVSKIVAQRGRWGDGTFNRHDITDNLTPALRAYVRFVHAAPGYSPTIHHQELFEACYEETGRISTQQYISSLRRAANLLGEDISPALLPNVNAVEGVLARLRQGKYKTEKFGPVGTALRRYGEMAEKNFSQGFQAAEDVPTDELPARLKVEVTRVVRDIGLANTIKELHGHRCQICDLRIELSAGRFYSEGHHLKPLGKKHNGPDVEGNVLCVCPNCHAKLDFAAIKIDPAKLRTVLGHAVRKEFIDYHNSLCS